MGGYPLRERAATVLAMAKAVACSCAGPIGPRGCLPHVAEEVLAALLVNPRVVPQLVAVGRPEPVPRFLEHRAGAVVRHERPGERPSRPVVGRVTQVCADCGALLEDGGPRDVALYPEGTTLYARPGALALGDHLALRMAGPHATVSCTAEWDKGNVTPLQFGLMRFVALLRVSTSGQALDGYGLDVQEQAVRAWAKAGGHRIVQVVSEPGISGAAPLSERVGLAVALSLVAAGKADGVVVPRLDRLARDLILQEQLIAEVDALGGVLRSALPTEDDQLLGDDPQRVLVRQILGAINQYERAIIRLRLQAGRLAKASKGGYIGGRPPYGWSSVRGELVPVPAEQAVRKEILSLARKGWSYREIAGRLNAAGTGTKDGKLWSPNSVRRVVKQGAKPGPQKPPTATNSADRKAS